MSVAQRAIRAVLFDLVGTLTFAISEEQRNRAHRRVAAVLGASPDAYLKTLLTSYVDRASGRRGSMMQTMRWVAEQSGAQPTERQLAMACAVRHATERDHLRLRPDAIHVLETLRAHGIRTAVVSDCTHEVPSTWRTSRLRRYVDTAVFSIEVGACKPDRRMYLTACDRLKVRPEECVYVGDGGSRELTGARAIGMTAVRLIAPDSHRHAAHLAEHSWNGPAIRALSEVLPLVGIGGGPHLHAPRRAEQRPRIPAPRRAEQHAPR